MSSNTPVSGNTQPLQLTMGYPAEAQAMPKKKTESAVKEFAKGAALGAGLTGTLIPTLGAKDRVLSGNLMKAFEQGPVNAVKELSRGGLLQMSATVPTIAVQKGAYSILTDENSTTGEKFAAGTVAGGASGLASTPSDGVALRARQPGETRTPLQIFQDPFRKHGLKGVVNQTFAGAVPTKVREAKFFIGAEVAADKASEATQRLFPWLPETPRKMLSTSATLAPSMALGSYADLLRAKMQLAATPTNRARLVECAKKITVPEVVNATKARFGVGIVAGPLYVGIKKMLDKV